MNAIDTALRSPATAAGQTVLSVKHYTDDLFAFTTTRPKGFRFRSGEFAMLGMEGEGGKPILRAYSIASPNWADELEFFSIKVPDGPLTSLLAKVRPGDAIILKPRATGTLVIDALRPGRTLWLVATGTGIAPFASIVRDPQTYERFEHVVLTHTCRTAAELEYGFGIAREIETDALLCEMIGDRLTHVASVTRDSPGERMLGGRMTDHIRSGALFTTLSRPPWGEDDRVMICGSTAMIADVRELCAAAGFSEGSNAKPGDFVVEKAFVG